MGDKVNSGMSYRPTIPCSMAGQYDNPMPELTLSPRSGSMNSATALTFLKVMCQLRGMGRLVGMQTTLTEVESSAHGYYFNRHSFRL
jgi:hypothetical protein